VLKVYVTGPDLQGSFFVKEGNSSSGDGRTLAREVSKRFKAWEKTKQKRKGFRTSSGRVVYFPPAENLHRAA